MSRMIDDEETLKDNGLIEIDGCNVAECKHFEDADCFNPAETVLSCESQPNCLFKQLQRLKAENEKLKNKKDEYYQNCLTYERQISELIQTLEEIRELNNKTVKIPIITEKINEVLQD